MHPQTTTQETPYSLTYGVEAMILVEVAEPTIRRQMFDLTLNEESLAVNLDLVNEFRDKNRFEEVTCKIRASRRSLLCEELPEGRPCLENAHNARKNEGKFSSN